MESTEVIFELERTTQLYERYFKFERRRQFKKVPSRLLFGFSITLILSGVFARVDILWILGLLSTSLIGIFLFYFFFRFEIAFNKFSKELEKKAKTSDKNFQFSFDSEAIFYKSKKMNTETKWQMPKDFKADGNVIFLYLENHNLLDIISEKILGIEKFQKFKEILVEKIKH